MSFKFPVSNITTSQHWKLWCFLPYECINPFCTDSNNLCTWIWLFKVKGMPPYKATKNVNPCSTMVVIFIILGKYVRLWGVVWWIGLNATMACCWLPDVECSANVTSTFPISWLICHIQANWVLSEVHIFSSSYIIQVSNVLPGRWPIETGPSINCLNSCRIDLTDKEQESSTFSGELM